MNKLKATLADFQGDLLTPLNYQTYNTSRIEVVPPEGYMYIVVRVTESSVQIPAIKFEILKEELEHYIREKNSDTPLVLFLSRFIQSNPKLLKKCRLHRLGYDASKYKRQQPITSSNKAERKREEAFVISVLKKKRDWKHLKEYFDQLKEQRMKFRRK